MFRITRKYLLGLMLGASVLPLNSCSANGTKQTPPVAQAAKDSVVITPEDKTLAEKYINVASKTLGRSVPIGERIMRVGRLMRNVPYVSNTLEVDSLKENLVINLRGLDCVTFYENALAIARVVRMHKYPTHEQYQNELKLLRYRGGEMNGYSSRLHYSSDYFYDNIKKGVLRDVTQEVGGTLAKKDTRTIDFMSKHRSAYKQLRASDDQYAQVAKIENEINARGGYYYIPKASVATIEKNLQQGDIVGIVTSINGLDCSHTGIVDIEDGTVHFLHASSALGKVVISEETLSEYLASSAKQIGIVVMRAVEVPSGYKD